MTGSIASRMPREQYDAIEALNISRLKELRRSPQHYQWALAHRRETDAMTLGIAAHVAVLEPERYGTEFAVWDRITDGGRSAPRNGKYWDAFCDANQGRKVLTMAENATALALARAVRSHEGALRYLQSGEPEVTLEWQLPTSPPRPARGRVDWLTRIDGQPYIVDLKTARDCRPFQFGNQCARLGLHLQLAYYHDGVEAITGDRPRVVVIVVESDEPHAVAVYHVPDDVIEQGREEYLQLLATLEECERTDAWPGPVPLEETLSLPTWAFGAPADDLGDLQLVA